MERTDRVRKENRASFTIALALLFLIAMPFTSASVDIVSPENDVLTRELTLTAEFLVNMDNATNCTLVIDGNKAAGSTNITSHEFNELSGELTQGAHTWKVGCSNANITEESEERNIESDITLPTVVLFNPQNNSLLNTSGSDFSFVALDNLPYNLACKLIIDGSILLDINATNSDPVTEHITGISDGVHIWSVNCTDAAGNERAGETRTMTVNTTIPSPTFELVLARSEWLLAENGVATLIAPQGTSIRMEVCPDISGFVECSIAFNTVKSTTGPQEVPLPYMNNAGKYILEVFFNHSGQTDIKTARYNVTNNIVIDVDNIDYPRKNAPIYLEAEATGGVGTLNYTWLMSTGTRVNSRKANITYSSPGSYTNIIIVNDEFNNSKNRSITLEVDDSFSIKIQARDAGDDSIIKQGSIELDGNTESLDANGEAYFYVRQGRREVTVLAENYSIYQEELNITKDETFKLLLEKLDYKINPTVTLIRPGNDSGLIDVTTELVFKSEHIRKTNCSIYVNEKPDGFFLDLGSVGVAANDGSEQPFGVMDLENKTYWWKVECVDDRSRSGMSSTWQFTVGKKLQVTTEEKPEIISRLDSKAKELSAILDDMNNLPPDVKAAAEAFGLISTIEKNANIIRNAVRDIDGLKFKSDLSESQRSAESERLAAEAEEAFKKTPSFVSLLDSKQYVDYINNEDLESLMKEYLARADSSGDKVGVIGDAGNSGDDNNKINKKISEAKLLKILEELQQEAVISTKAVKLSVTFQDGTSKELSGIIRDIKTYNLTAGAFILEVVPKTVSESANDIFSPADFSVIKEDPILRFELKGDTSLIYYVEGGIDLELFKDSKTALFIDPDKLPDDKITGFAVSSIKLPKINWVLSLVITMVLLGGLVIGGVKYDGIHAARYAIYTLQRKNKLHYVSVIINDIKDNLDLGDLSKASELYKEAGDAYADLPAMAKNDAYGMIAEAAEKIKSHQELLANNGKIAGLNSMISRIQSFINAGQIVEAIEEYKQIESSYHSLDQATQESVHPWLVDIGNKIQVMACSNKKGYYESRYEESKQ